MSHFNYISDDAPFNAEQRAWLNNLVGKFIQDLTNGQGLAGGGGATIPVTILVGSQTGNSEGLARKLAKAMGKLNFEPSVVDMAEYEKEKLVEEENVLIITSTYGDGEPPDNAEDFHEWILSDDAPSLEGVRYSVLALGDTEYPDFCQVGIEFDQRFLALGAEQIYPRVDCDVDFDEPYAQWKEGVMDALGASAASAAPAFEEPTEDGYTKKNPFPSMIRTNYNLNAEESERSTHHLELSLDGSGLEYEVGDALGVYPRNDDEVVDEILQGLPFNPNEEVPTPEGQETTLREALLANYDIRNLNQKLLVEWQKRSGSPFLRSLIDADSKEAYDDFCWGRELVDLVNEHPADFIDAEEFVGVLKKLQPRLYSIASSPNAHPGEVHLTVAVVEYHSHFRDRGGVCSTFLAHRAEDLQPGVFVHSNKAFRLPESGETPVIMVGPGTGIAPFRAFLEERKVSEASGGNWLFFGNPHKELDFLYEDELKAMQEEGVLTRLDTAFSRDQAEKVYVQHRMLEAGEELWQWLDEKKASFYVCGDASRMAKDVDQALHEVVQAYGKMSEEEAVAYVKQLKKEKRYCRDVY